MEQARPAGREAAAESDPNGDLMRQLRQPLAVALLVFLAVAETAGAGDLAGVHARGKLIMLTYPVQGTHFISADLDALRQGGQKLTEARAPRFFRGIDVELMNGFARRLGVALEVHPITGGYGELLPALLRGEGDLVASELTITPKRQAMAAFSTHYVANWIAIVTRSDSALQAAADLTGKKGAVLRGSSHVEFVTADVPGVHILETSFDLESLEAVANRTVDFATMDTSTPPGDVVDAMHPDLKVAFRLRQIGDGVAVRKGSDLLAPLNAYLAGLKSSGELDRIFARNGFHPQAAAPAAPPRPSRPAP